MTCSVLGFVILLRKHSVWFPVWRYPGQRSEVRAGRFSLTELAPLVVHIVSWGGAQRLASHYALEKPIPALHLTAQVSAELGGAPHRR